MNEKYTGSDLTPLIDVIFLLIVFFLLTPAISEKKIEVNLPESMQGEADRSAETVFTVDSEDNIFYGTTPLLIYDIPHILEKIILENPDKESVLVQSDKHSSFGVILKIMEEASIAGYRSVSFSVTDYSD